jgi:hypothetical protein
VKNWLIVRGWWPCCWRWFYNRYHGDPEIDYDEVKRDREDGGYKDGPDRCPRCGGDASDNYFDRSFWPGVEDMATRCVSCGFSLVDAVGGDGNKELALPEREEGDKLV